MKGDKIDGDRCMSQDDWGPLAGPWEKHPHSPIFTPAGGSAWDGRFLQHPCPVLRDGRWYLYCTGNNGHRYAVGVARLMVQ